MSYKSNVIVGRFTEADAEELRSRNPGATAYIPPVIETRAEARKEAIKIANQDIAYNEVIVSTRMKDETDAGWAFSITVADK